MAVIGPYSELELSLLGPPFDAKDGNVVTLQLFYSLGL